MKVAQILAGNLKVWNFNFSNSHLQFFLIVLSKLLFFNFFNLRKQTYDYSSIPCILPVIVAFSKNIWSLLLLTSKERTKVQFTKKCIWCPHQKWSLFTSITAVTSLFHLALAQCANQESTKVERYSKTNCTGWTSMPQGFQIYFVWNPSK